MARLAFGAIALLSLAACAGPRNPVTSAGDDPTEAAGALVLAEPRDWPERAAAVLAHEDPDAAATALVAALGPNRGAPGEVCAIAVLGTLGSDVARAPLEELVGRGGDAGAEAAMALGRLRAPRSAPRLREALGDDGLDPLTRTAAAGALLELGETGAAVPFLHAILVAGTPAGVESSARYGLPDKARWALERHVAIEAIARHTGGETFGLDPDDTWPALQRKASLFRDAVGGAR